ncbi:hypothetical protein [Polaromonas jejuensis]|uniref:Uncharacterized protein n=1 Tax=Polaromonas jejuensis TaxID=457502 RepID=A0ABW0Q618_9BURK|nr:hypothetical protein [Polaromonas jejuensis]
MPRFTAPPPNGDSRQALQKRARDARLPAAPEEKGRWPFSVANTPEASTPSAGDDEGRNPAARSDRAGKPQE